MDSVRPPTPISGTHNPTSKQAPGRSLLVSLFEQHFWRCYLVLVTMLVAVVAFAATTGEYVPLWAALGTAITSVLTLRCRQRQRRRNARR